MAAFTRTQPRRSTPAIAHAPVLMLVASTARDPVTGMPAFEVRAGERVVGRVTWRDFALDSGWQFRFVGDRRTLRKVHASIADALVDQGGLSLVDAVNAVLDCPRACALDRCSQSAAKAVPA